MRELKLNPTDEQLLTKELTKYAEEGATDDELREFRSSFIEELKKKDDSTTGSKDPGQPLSENGKPKKTTEQILADNRKYEELQDFRKNLAHKYEEAQKGYDYAVDIQNKFDARDDETVKLFMGGDWDTTATGQANQLKSAQGRIDSLKKQKKVWAMETQNSLQPEINKLAEEIVGNDLGNYTMMGGVSENMVVPDPYKINSAATRIANNYGFDENSHFRRYMYNTLSGVVEMKIIEPRAKEIFNESPEKAEIESAIGKQLEEGFTTDDVEAAKLKIQAGALGEKLQAQAKEEIAPIETAYKKAADDINSQLVAINTQAEELNSVFQSGALTPEQYKTAFDELAAKQQQLKDAFPSYDDYVKNVNVVNSKYNQAYRDQVASLTKAADQKVKAASEKYSAEFKINPELAKKYSKAYSDAYKKAGEERLNKLSESEKQSWKFAQPGVEFFEFLGKSTLLGLGGSFKGLGVTLNIPELEVYGDYLEKKNFMVPTNSSEVSDLFDPRNLTKLTGQLAGGMAPSIVASATTALATGGAGAPASAQMLAAGAAGWASETADITGRAYDQVFEKTGVSGEAQIAAQRSFDSQVDIIWAYTLEGLPFISKGLSMVPTKAGRMAAGGAIETLTELTQEIPQNIAEENILAGREPWKMAHGGTVGYSDIASRVKETAIQIAPVALLGAGGQINSVSRDQAMMQTAVAQASKVKLRDVIEDQGKQFVFSTVLNKGENYGLAVINAMYASGQIDEAAKNDMINQVSQAVQYRDRAKALKLSPHDTMIYSWLSAKADEALSNVEANANDPVASEVFAQQAKDYQQQATAFIQGKDPQFYSIRYADGSEYLFSLTDAKQIFSDPKMIEEVRGKKVRIAAFGDKAASELKTLEKNAKNYVAPAVEPVTPTAQQAPVTANVKKPTDEQITQDVKEGNFVTFEYKSEDEMPESLKDKVSSSAEVNGEKIFRVTLPKSEADYLLKQEKPATQPENIPVEEPPVIEILEQKTEEPEVIQANVPAPIAQPMLNPFAGIADDLGQATVEEVQPAESERVNQHTPINEGMSKSPEKIDTSDAQVDEIDTSAEDKLRTAAPVSRRLAEINNELGNLGYRFEMDMDGQTANLVDSDGELIDVEDLPENAQPLAEEFMDIASRLEGALGDLLTPQSISEGEKEFQGEEAQFEEVKPQELPEAFREWPISNEKKTPIGSVVENDAGDVFVIVGRKDGVVELMDEDGVSHKVNDREGFYITKKEFKLNEQEPTDERTIEVVESDAETAITEAESARTPEEVREALEKIEAQINAVSKKIKNLTEVYTTEGINHEAPNYEIGKKAKREITSYMKAIAEMTGWEISKNGVRANIAPAGGEVYVELSIPGTPLTMYAAFKYDPDIVTAYGGYDNYTLSEIFYRVEDRTKKGSDQYVGSNQRINIEGRSISGGWGTKSMPVPSAKELATIFAKEAIPYVVEYINANKPSQEVKDVQDLLSGEKSPQEVIKDIVDQSGIPTKNVVVGSVPKPPKEKPSKEDKRKVRDEKIKADIDAKLKALLNSKGGTTLSSGGIDPEKLKQAIDIVALYTKAGVYKFADIIQDTAESLGVYASEIFEEMKAAYAAYRESGATDEEHAEMDSSVRSVKFQDIVGPNKLDKPADKISARREFVNTIKEFTLDQVPINGIIHLRKLAAEAGLEYSFDVELQELVELALTEIARDYALDPTLRPTQKFSNILGIYERQPTISQRTSNRIELQQYSTPLPMAYIAGRWVKEINPASVLEPNAGNGMLVLNFDPAIVTANEIDADRLSNLKEQGFKEVKNQDANLPFDGTYDGIMMNPPFGKASYITENGYRIYGLDPQMTVNALKNMSDNGRAAIIIGGHNEYGPDGMMSGNERFFFNYLYSHYNVADVINMDGSLYYKQGTTFPVRMILIDGRKPQVDQKSFAPRFDPEKNTPITTYPDLFDRMSNTIKQNERNNSIQPAVDTNAQVGNDVRNTGAGNINQGTGGGSVQIQNTSTSQGGGKSGTSSNRPVRENGNTGRGSESASDSTRNNGESTVSGVGSGVSPRQQDASGNQQTGSSGSVRQPVNKRPDRKPVDLSHSKAQYEPQSTARGVDSFIPTVMATEAYHALEKLEAQIGKTVDEYVTDNLKYDSVEEMQKYFSAEQVDAIALAIYNMSTDKALIVGDMTGVGKGRIAAGIIRYCVLNGKKPFFITVKPGLFSDMYRDLNDIDFIDVKPFIVNNAEQIDDPRADAEASKKQKALHKISETERKQVTEAVKMGNTSVLDNYDVIFSTYSQFQNGIEMNPDGLTIKQISDKSKAKFFVEAAKGSVIIMDESHNASGASKVGRLFQDGLATANSAIFLSATFAKRPDNMLVYAPKTAMSESNMTQDDLINAIVRGGVPLQEIISSQLVEAGQMVRRERQFFDWQTEFIELKDKEKEHREKADKITDVMRSIIDFEDKYIKGYVEQVSDEIKDQAESVLGEGGSAGVGADRTPFASKLFNVVNQMLFAIKAEAAAEEAVRAAKEGLKPVVAFQSTMGSFLFSEEDGSLGLKPGDMLNEGFSVSLQKALENSRKFRKRLPSGEVVKEEIPLDKLPFEAQLEYRKIEDKIMAASEGIPLSPIDAMIYVLEKNGLTYGEITGRNERIRYNSDGTGVAERRRDKDVNTTVSNFNSGKIDVILLNQSGATGFSMHASSKFKDQRQRVMIMVQPELDINIEVQKRGRIDRTGQVVRGLYRAIVSMIPAEQRLWMMYKNKIRSLDANTSGDQKSTKDSLAVADFMNQVGDKVIYQYLEDNPDMNKKLREPYFSSDGNAEPKEESARKDFDEGGNPWDGAASKVTGRVAALSMADQEKFYTEVSELYAKEIEYLESNDINPLESKTLDLKAETVSRQVLKAGMPNSTSAFGAESILEQVEANVLKKPMKSSEINNRISEIIGDKDKKAYKLGLIDDIEKYKEEQTEKLKEHYDHEKSEAKTREIAKLDLKINEINTQNPGTISVEERDSRAKQLSDSIDKEYETRRSAAEYSLDANLAEVQKRFAFFNVGEIYGVGSDLTNPDSDGYSRGVFMGYEIGTKTKNPYSRSNVSMVFATADGRREVKIPLTKVDAINAIVRRDQYLSPKEKEFENWDSTTRTEAREKRFIVTGNILQAMSGLSGQVVSYTTKDGKIKKGYLLRKDFTLKAEGTVSVPMITAWNIAKKKGGKIDITSGEIRIVGDYNSGEFFITVPTSKNLGQKFYGNPSLKDLVRNGNFYTRSGKMVADISESNIDKVISLLTNEYRLQALVASKDYEAESGFGDIAKDIEPQYQANAENIREITDEETRDRIKNIISALENVSPGTRVVLHNSKESYAKAIADMGEPESRAKTSAVFDPFTGTIHINTGEFGNTTLYHEAVHPVLSILSELNPELVDDLYSQIEADPNLEKFIRFGQAYATAEEQRLEAVTEFLAAVADGQLDSYRNTPLWDKIKAFFNKLIKMITGKNALDINLDNTTELKKFAGKFAEAVKTGTPIRNSYQKMISGGISYQISKEEAALQRVKEVIVNSYNTGMNKNDIEALIDQEPRVKALIEKYSSVSDFINASLTIKPTPVVEPTVNEIEGYDFTESGPEREKATVKRAIEGVTPDFIKNEIIKMGTTYKERSHYEADLLAQDFIQKVGLPNAVTAAINRDVPEDVAIMIVAYASVNPNELGDAAATPGLVQKISDMGRGFGRGISALQYIYDKYSVGYDVETKIEQYKAENNGYIPEMIEKKFRELDAEMKSLKDEIENLEKDKARLESEAHIQAIKDEIARTSATGKLPEAERKKLSDKIRKAKIARPNVFNSASPAVIAWDTAVEIVASAVDAGEFISEAIKKGIAHIEQTDWYKGLDTEKQAEAIDSFSKEMNQDAVPGPYVNDDGKLVIPNSLLRSLIAEGHDTIEALTEVISDMVNSEYPEYGFSEREVRDAISGYGKIASMDNDDISVALRKAKQIGRVISAIEDVQEKQRPLRSGLQRDKLDVEVRALQKELRELMKDLPMDEEATSRQLKSALDAIKSRLRNSIEDIQRQIDTGIKSAKARGVSYDQEAKDLAEELAQLRKVRDQIFGEEMSEEKRISLATRLIEAQIRKYDEAIENNDIAAKSKNKVTSPELEALRDQLKARRKQLRQMREDAGIIEQQKLQSAKRAAQKTIEMLEERLRTKNYAPKKRKSLLPDDELSKKRARVRQLREEIDEEILNAQNRNFRKAKAWWNALDQLWNVPRTIKASLEFSQVLIQGGPTTVHALLTSPSQLKEAFEQLGKNAASESTMKRTEQLMKELPWWEEAKAAGLDLSEYGAGMNKGEEGFAIGWGHFLWDILVSPTYAGGKKFYDDVKALNPTKMFERGGTAYLNYMRLKEYERGRNMLLAKGVTFQNNPQAYKDVATVVNVFTGRAPVNSRINRGLSFMLFSPKNWYSAIRMVTPVGLGFFLSHTGKDAAGNFELSASQKLAARYWTTYMGSAMAVLLISKFLLGDDDDDETDVSFDPRSSDFMKIRLRDTRVDPWGGKSQMITFQARMIMGEYVNSSGEVLTIGEKNEGQEYSNYTRMDLITNLIKSKLHPSAAFLYDNLDAERNKYGQRVDQFGNVLLLKDQFGELIVPMYLASIKENYEVQPALTATALTALGLFGVGTNTYGTPQEMIEKEYMKLLGEYEFNARKEASDSVKRIFRQEAEYRVKQKLIKEKYNRGGK